MQDDPLRANAFRHEYLGQLPGDWGDYVIRRCD
jgi:hypothetical protein